jgi:uncharacterized protein YjdB
MKNVVVHKETGNIYPIKAYGTDCFYVDSDDPLRGRLIRIGFDGSKTYSLSLLYKEDGRSYQTAYTPVYVITHPTAGSLAITLPTTAGGKYAVGASYQLGAVFTPAYITETDVTWSVDDTTLATIDANGVLTPIKNGTVTITCTSKDNPAVSATVTIEITGGNIPLNEGGVSQGGAE